MKRTILALLLALPCTLSGQQTGAETTYEKARKNFIRHVAASLGVEENSLEANPINEEEEFYKSLKTGDLNAFTAEDRARKKTVTRGFSGMTTEGQATIAFNGYIAGIGQPGGIADLLKAASALDPEKRMKADDLSKRILWCLDPAKNGTSEKIFDAKHVADLGWEPPEGVGPARYLPQKTGIVILFYSISQGNTGTLNYHKYSITVLPDFKTLINREDL